MALDLATTTGFDDPARDSQTVFRVVMNALARPTRLQKLAVALQPPTPLTPELAAIALALADHDAPIWLDPPLARSPAAVTYLRFHAGAPIVSDPKEAAFALVCDPANLPPFEAFAFGTEEYPDRSTTIVIAVDGFDGPEALTVEGPGLETSGSMSPTPLPADFPDRMVANHAMFPRGLDVVFAAPGLVAGLPRSSRSSGRA